MTSTRFGKYLQLRCIIDIDPWESTLSAMHAIILKGLNEEQLVQVQVEGITSSFSLQFWLLYHHISLPFLCPLNNCRGCMFFGSTLLPLSLILQQHLLGWCLLLCFSSSCGLHHFCITLELYNTNVHHMGDKHDGLCTQPYKFHHMINNQRQIW